MTPDQPDPYGEATERYHQDAAFHARVMAAYQQARLSYNIIFSPGDIALILVLDERARAEMASRRPDYSKELQLLAQQAGYLDLDGEPTKKLRDALYGDLAWNTNPVMVLSTEMQQAIAQTREFGRGTGSFLRDDGAGPGYHMLKNLQIHEINLGVHAFHGPWSYDDGVCRGCGMGLVWPVEEHHEQRE